MDHKLKKKLIMARNKRNQMIFQHARIHKAEHDRITEEMLDAMTHDGDELTREQKMEQDEVWSEKVQKVRNRLTNKKRNAHDRWNRMSGTSGAGSHAR